MVQIGPNLVPTPQVGSAPFGQSRTTFDYFNPMMAAAIVTDKGATYPLWTRGKDGTAFNIPGDPSLGPTLSTLKALSFLSELTVENQLGDIPRITAVLTPPFQDAIMFLDSELIEFGLNRLQVQFGYARGAQSDGQSIAKFSHVMEAIMLRPEVSLGADISITLTAQGVRGTAIDKTESGAQYTDKTRAEIIREICIRNNMFANLSATTPEGGGDSEVDNLMNKEKVSYTHGWKTDWAVVQLICWEARCFATTRAEQQASLGTNSTLIVIPKSVLATDKPAVTLSMFQFSKGTLGGDVYPILNASSETGAVYLPGIRAILIEDIDPITKKRKKNITTDKESKAVRTWFAAGDLKDGDPTNMAPPNEDKQTGFFRRPGDPTNDTFVQQSQAAFEGLTKAQGVSLEVETMGIPTIYPGQVVAVTGLGLRLSTNYGIFKVTHRLGNAGFTTVLNLISNTGSFLAKQLQAKAEGPTNSNTAPQSAGDQISVPAVPQTSGKVPTTPSVPSPPNTSGI